MVKGHISSLFSCIPFDIMVIPRLSDSIKLRVCPYLEWIDSDHYPPLRHGLSSCCITPGCACLCRCRSTNSCICCCAGCTYGGCSTCPYGLPSCICGALGKTRSAASSPGRPYGFHLYEGFIFFGLHFRPSIPNSLAFAKYLDFLYFVCLGSL